MPEGSAPTGGFASLRPLFAPQSVAVIGASADPTRIGGRPVAAMRTADFAEVDEVGAAAQARLAAIAQRSGMRILGPNTLGLFDARIGWFPTFTASLHSFRPLPGRIGIASQSGAFGTHIFSVAALATMLSRLSLFAAAGERLSAIDLNPVLVLGEGEGAYAADAVMELQG